MKIELNDKQKALFAPLLSRRNNAQAQINAALAGVLSGIDNLPDGNANIDPTGSFIEIKEFEKTVLEAPKES